MRTWSLLGALTAVVVVVTGCGSASSGANGGASSGASGSASSGAKDACLVVTGSGINDRGFNQSAWEGVQAGVKSSGLTPRYIQANQVSDYLTATQAFTHQPCQIIVTTSFAMTDATKTVAEQATNKKFAIVDVSYNPPLPNVQGLVFDAGQAAFLAGYLAAGVSKSGIVAVYGGVQIPPVTLFMDGYADGITYYNSAHHTNVRVLGWDKAKQQGTFVGNFTDQAKGKQLANGFIDQGADVIFGLGSLADLGASAAVQATGGKVKMIWPNTDGCLAVPRFCNVFLTSVLKNVAVATKNVTERAGAGKFQSGTYIGTLANNGVGLAPFHQLSGDVPAKLVKELAGVRQKIIGGEITVTSVAVPKGG